MTLEKCVMFLLRWKVKYLSATPAHVVVLCSSFVPYITHRRRLRTPNCAWRMRCGELSKYLCNHSRSYDKRIMFAFIMSLAWHFLGFISDETTKKFKLDNEKSTMKNSQLIRANSDWMKWNASKFLENFESTRWCQILQMMPLNLSSYRFEGRI